MQDVSSSSHCSTDLFFFPISYLEFINFHFQETCRQENHGQVETMWRIEVKTKL